MSDTVSTASSLSSCAKVKASRSVKCRMTSVKEWIHRIRPARLVIVLILSIVYFLVLLAFSHITHALTLLVQCYHMVCNIIALSGSLIMVKVSILFPQSVRRMQALCVVVVHPEIHTNHVISIVQFAGKTHVWVCRRFHSDFRLVGRTHQKLTMIEQQQAADLAYCTQSTVLIRIGQ